MVWYMLNIGSRIVGRGFPQEACTSAPLENKRWSFFSPRDVCYDRTLRWREVNEGKVRRERGASVFPRTSLSHISFFSRNNVRFCWREGKGELKYLSEFFWLLLHTDLIWLDLHRLAYVLVRLLGLFQQTGPGISLPYQVLLRGRYKPYIDALMSKH